jgi:hypothetical protein
VQGVDQVAKNVARILTLAQRCAHTLAFARPHDVADHAINLATNLVRREDIPFYAGAGEPLLPLAEPMDAVFVRTVGDRSPAASWLFRASF